LPALLEEEEEEERAPPHTPTCPEGGYREGRAYPTEPTHNLRALPSLPTPTHRRARRRNFYPHTYTPQEEGGHTHTGCTHTLQQEEEENLPEDRREASHHTGPTCTPTPTCPPTYLTHRRRT